MQKNIPLNGWLNLYKPQGITSAKAVALVKRNLNPKKIGHAGTLDPLASGVLPLALGEATKTMQFCMDTDKEYEFTVKWGETTTTLDSEGEVVDRSQVLPTSEQIQKVLPQFIGEISQTPPVYSAIKINGKRAYDLARQGVAVDMASRVVRIYELEVVGSSFQVSGEVGINTSHLSPATHTTFRVSCGKGTYIRSLARDIAHGLGTLGYVTSLVRTKVGKFSIKDAISLEDIEKTVYKDAVSGVLLPVDTVLDDIQVLEFTPEDAIRIRHGQKILLEKITDFDASFCGVFIAKSDGVLVAICESAVGLIKPIRVFNL